MLFVLSFQKLVWLIIYAIFFLAINIISYKHFVKQKSFSLLISICLVAILEAATSLYIDTLWVYQYSFIFIGILSIMTISDLQNMEVPTWTLIALPASAIVSFVFLCLQSSSILWANIAIAIITWMLLTILALLFNDNLGGADIIMIFCVCLLFGGTHMLYMLIIGSLVSIIGMWVYSKIKKTQFTGTPLPFLPGLTLGFLIACFLV